MHPHNLEDSPLVALAQMIAAAALAPRDPAELFNPNGNDAAPPAPIGENHGVRGESGERDRIGDGS